MGCPVNARSIWSLSKRLGSGWALGGHPETSAHPGVEGTRFRATRPLWSSHGLVGEKTLFACGTGPAGDGVACPEEYSGLAAAGLTLCRETLRRVDIQPLFAGRTVSVTPWRIGEAWPV